MNFNILQLLKSRSMRWAFFGVLIGVLEAQWGIVTDSLTPYIGAHAMGFVTIIFGIGAGIYRMVTTTGIANK